MTQSTELHDRLMADARGYDPAVHNRSLLGPYRDVLFLWRAKFMSYEQIAAALTRHGIKVSPAGVGAYCRRTFTKTDLTRARHQFMNGTATVTSPPKAVPQPVEPSSGRRGPKIARDDY